MQIARSLRWQRTKRQSYIIQQQQKKLLFLCEAWHRHSGEMGERARERAYETIKWNAWTIWRWENCFSSLFSLEDNPFWTDVDATVCRHRTSFRSYTMFVVFVCFGPFRCNVRRIELSSLSCWPTGEREGKVKTDWCRYTTHTHDRPKAQLNGREMCVWFITQLSCRRSRPNSIRTMEMNYCSVARCFDAFEVVNSGDRTLHGIAWRDQGAFARYVICCGSFGQRQN